MPNDNLTQLMSRSQILQEIDRELLRIGFELDELPDLLLPPGVSESDLLDRLREIPAGAGSEAFDELTRSFAWPTPAPWQLWPHPGERFDFSDYVEALRQINMQPLEATAEEFCNSSAHVPTWLLALLYLASPELRHRVLLYIEDTKRTLMQRGTSSEIVEMADYEFRSAVRELEGRVQEVAQERRATDGSG